MGVYGSSYGRGGGRRGGGALLFFLAAGAALLPVGLTAMYWQGFSAGGVLLLLCEATAVTAGAAVMLS